jgi:hypothetical protein
MSDHHRKLLKGLRSELAALIRSQASRDPRERAAGARRWEELRERSSRSSGEGFREDLRGTLSRAVERLEELEADLDRRDSRSSK